MRISVKNEQSNEIYDDNKNYNKLMNDYNRNENELIIIMWERMNDQIIKWNTLSKWIIRMRMNSDK